MGVLTALLSLLGPLLQKLAPLFAFVAGRWTGHTQGQADERTAQTNIAMNAVENAHEVERKVDTAGADGRRRLRDRWTARGS
jgi:hypothetical protein